MVFIIIHVNRDNCCKVKEIKSQITLCIMFQVMGKLVRYKWCLRYFSRMSCSMFDNTFPCLALWIFVLHVFISGLGKTFPLILEKERVCRCLCHNNEMIYGFTVDTTHISLVIFTHNFMWIHTTVVKTRKSSKKPLCVM